jgi:putative transposase
MDEFTRECLAIDVAKRLTSEDVLERLSDLFIHRGVPGHIRSDSRESSRPSVSESGWGELA